MDGDSDDTAGRSDSVHSMPSPGDDLLYDLDDLRHGNLSQEYAEYLHDDLINQVDGSSGASVPGSTGSRSPPPTPPSQIATRFRHLGLADSGDLSDAPDFLADDTEDDETNPATQSDGELSGMNSVEDDEGTDEDYGDEEPYDDVPNPPQLPAVSEERLQEAWPLGEASFNIFLCPITHDVMTDPVVGADGYTYERSAIARWFETSRKSPVTGQSLPHTDLVPNHSVRTLLKTIIDMTEGIAAPGVASARAATASPAAGIAALRSPLLAGLTGSGSAGAVASGFPLRSPLSLATGNTPALGSSASPPLGAAELRHGRQEEEQASTQESPRDLVEARREHDFALASAVAAQRSSQRPTSNGTAALEMRSLRERARDAESLIIEATGNAGQVQNTLATSLSGAQLSSTAPSSAGAQRERPPSSVLDPSPRPSSQPQPAQQAPAASSHPRPQSSLGCPQQRPQTPSTALPPLRPGRRPPAPDPSAPPRGATSPPPLAPPHAFRGGSPAGARSVIPATPPPFPPPPSPQAEVTRSHSLVSGAGFGSTTSLGVLASGSGWADAASPTRRNT